MKAGKLARLREENAALRAQVEALQSAVAAHAWPQPVMYVPPCVCGTSAVCPVHPRTQPNVWAGNPVGQWTTVCGAAGAPTTISVPVSNKPLTFTYDVTAAAAGCAGLSVTLYDWPQ